MPIRKAVIPRRDRIVRTEKMMEITLKNEIALSIGVAIETRAVNTSNTIYPYEKRVEKQNPVSPSKKLQSSGCFQLKDGVFVSCMK